MKYKTGDIVVVKEYDGWSGNRPVRRVSFIGRARRDFTSAQFWDDLHRAQHEGLAFSRVFLKEGYVEPIEWKEFSLAD